MARAEPRFPSPLRGQTGGISVIAVMALFIAFLLFLVVVNTGNALNLRDRTADVARMLALPALANQLTYRAEGRPPTPRLLRRVLREADTAAQLGELGEDYAVEYQFGRYDEDGGFEPLEAESCDCDPQDPDPAEDEFNAVALEVRTDVPGLGAVERYFDIGLPTVRGRALYALDPDGVQECYCEQYCSPSLLGLVSCLACEVGYTLGTAVRWLLIDPSADLGEALRCLLGSVVLVVDTAWDWTFGGGSIVLAGDPS